MGPRWPTADPSMRAAIFGLGGVAERIHLPACKEVAEIEVIAACDPSAEARRKGLAPRIYETAGELLSNESPDLVIVGAPPAAHFDLCKAAIEADANVLCEEPFTETLKQADQLIDLAESRGKLLAVNTQYRFMEIYRRTRERIAAGDFGQPCAIQAWQQMNHPPAAETVDWRRQLTRSTLYEFGGHAVDLLCLMFDALPETISASIPRIAGHHSDVLVQATLRFPGDRLATLWLNRATHAPRRYLEMRVDCSEASLRLSLGGLARASLEWTGRPNLRASYVRGGQAREERASSSRVYARQSKPAFMSATAAHLREIVRLIDAGSADLTGARRARHVLATTLAGYASAADGGRPIEIA